MEDQVPRHQFHVSLGAADPMEEPLTVGFPLPRHTDTVGLYRATPKRATSLTGHDHHLGQIFAEDHAVKKFCHGCEGPL